MESTITKADIIELTKMISEGLEIEMSIKTYLKITNENKELDTNRVPKVKNEINGIHINFNNSIENDAIKLRSKYKPNSKKPIELLLK